MISNIRFFIWKFGFLSNNRIFDIKKYGIKSKMASQGDVVFFKTFFDIKKFKIDFLYRNNFWYQKLFHDIKNYFLLSKIRKLHIKIRILDIKNTFLNGKKNRLIFMPRSEWLGAYCFCLDCLSDCLSFCLFVCLLSILTFAITFEP